MLIRVKHLLCIFFSSASPTKSIHRGNKGGCGQVCILNCFGTGEGLSVAKKIVRGSLRKHPFLLALRPLGTSPREMSPAMKSEEKRMFPQAMSGEKLGWIVSASVAEIKRASRVAGQYEDPIKAITCTRVVYPFRIVKMNLNIFNKHNECPCPCRRTLDRL